MQKVISDGAEPLIWNLDYFFLNEVLYKIKMNSTLLTDAEIMICDLSV